MDRRWNALMKKYILEECHRIALNNIKQKKHPQWDCYKHFSFIIQNGKIIEWGMNRSAEPLIGYPEWGKLHAECDAYFKAKGLLDTSDPFGVINIRMGINGNLKISKPCNCCQQFLKRLNCREIWFSTELGFARLII